MKQRKELRVSAIKNGTVIDHIPAQNLFKVINILQLDRINNPMTFGANLESQKLGSKAIVKISDKYFKDKEINKIALVAPDAKLNIIKDYKVVEKAVVEVPDMVTGIVKCVNPKCITNNENVIPKYQIIKKGEDVSLKCHYCEKITDQDHIKLL